MVKRFSKRRGARMHRRTRRGGVNLWHPTTRVGDMHPTTRVGDMHPVPRHELKGGRKKMIRTRRRNRRGGLAGNIGAATADVRCFSTD